ARQIRLVNRLRASWLAGKTRPIEYRISQLEALGRFLDEKKQSILDVLAADLSKGEFSDILLVRNEVNYAINNLSAWMKDEHVEKNLVVQLDSAFVRKDPYGVALIIGPWNYPIHLLLVPMIGAIAAGNCVIIKPSEISKYSEALIAEMLPNYLDKDCFAVVTAGVEETTKLLENKFDYIFFTGNPRVGKIIMKAAATHLTPVTLELGGKNPCYVADQCDLQNAANRIVWGRFFNAGQSCIAPDYVLCTLETQEKLLPEIFGPILPIVTVANLEEAIDFINARERPLSLYAFSCDNKVIHQLLDRTSSGGFCGNDTLMHVALVSLPFGGIGNSGMGKYHGKFSFDTFSHHRASLLRNAGLEAINRVRYPPYSDQKMALQHTPTHRLPDCIG
uniref:Aldehyde dehydrogenase family 3 member B1-like n=1 Tax=Crocodylus porosus TaxID=8502 RepID=A0A7M4FXC9_CROPO